MSNNRNLGNFAEYTNSGNLPVASIPNLGEITTIVAPAATGTINYNLKTQSVLYYSVNATGNVTLNFRGDGTTTFATFLPIGQSVSAKFLMKNGGTAYYLSAIQIDGNAQSVNWAGGTAPTAGIVNTVDEYDIAIIQTAAAVYTVTAQKAGSSGATPVPTGGLWYTPGYLGCDGTSTRTARSLAVNSSGLFVAVCDSNGASVSSDGVNWSVPVANVPFASSSIAANSGGTFYAVDRVGWNYATTTDGVTWSASLKFNGYVGAGSAKAIAISSAGRYVVVGVSSSFTTAFVSTSSNGTTWTTPATPASFANEIMNAITVNSAGLFVAVGGDASGPCFSTSSNGTLWTSPARFNGFTSTASSFATSIAVNSSGKFVVVGRSWNGVGASTFFSTSTDGSTWTTPAPINYTTEPFIPNSICVSPSGRFMVVMQNVGGNSCAGYSYSDDGSSWSTVIQLGKIPAQFVPNAVACSSSGKFGVVGIPTSATQAMGCFTV